MQGIKTILKNLPNSPGVYKMKDREGRIIYIGKAKNLKHRVSQYFQKDYAHSTRTRKLLENTADIEYTETDSELEALMLENNLIKELRPKYNILMKDDKSYVYIKVDLSEELPRISLLRQHALEKQGREKNAKYFGPKLASNKVYETLRILKKLFPYQHWEGINYYFKDMQDTTTPEERAGIARSILDFLSGKIESIEARFEREMKEAAAARLFEKAGRIRDKLIILRSFSERQKITVPNRADTDAINFTTENGRVYFNIFLIREGKLIDQENFMLDAFEMKKPDEFIDMPEFLQAFLIQYYEKAAEIPKEILIPQTFDDKETLEKWLAEKRGDKVHIIHPQKGEKNKLIELSFKNAISFAKQYKIKWMAETQKETALIRLAEVLGIQNNGNAENRCNARKQGVADGAVRSVRRQGDDAVDEAGRDFSAFPKVLKRIEGYDISHLGGNETVASMIVFENGIPKNDHYRHFKMRTVSDKPDDYRSMEEVLTRRLKYLAKAENITVKKASKKHIALIKKWGRKGDWRELFENPDIENFIILMKDKKEIGMAHFLELQKSQPAAPPAEAPKERRQGVFEITDMYIISKMRGKNLSYEFMRQLIKRIKDKRSRLYISVEKELLDHWLEFGFIQVNNPPEFIKERNKYWEDLDRKSYTILAYYKGQKKNADPSFMAKPDLIVVDGGKGQLSAALLVLKQLKLDIPVIALAKRLEEIYLPGKKTPLLLEERDEALKLLQRIRDESHRFAITFHRDLHRKAILQSQ